MVYLENAYVGALRKLNWKTGDTGPVLQGKKSTSLFQSLKKLAEQEGNNHG